jgi:ZIP family zinc transporter
MSQPVLLAFAVTTAAGLATAIGAAMGLFAKTTNHRFLALALGFSAGVMLFISFFEILPKSVDMFGADRSYVESLTWASLAFIGGLVLMAVLYRLLPDWELPGMDTPTHQPAHGSPPSAVGDRVLLRSGVLVAFAVALHNFPEGIATFFITLEDPALGIATAISIGIHNIPEGIAVAVPLYYALGKRWLAFLGGLVSGLAEPIGALLGYLILRPFISDSLIGGLFAVVAGIMVYIAIDSLLPAARQYDRGQLAMYGVIAGMAVMAISLILFALA